MAQTAKAAKKGGGGGAVRTGGGGGGGGGGSGGIARPLAAAVGLVGTTVAALRCEGRIWYCECGDWSRVWSGNVWSSHCSQHPVDPYSITHHTHGLVFYWMLAWTPGLRSIPLWWRWVIAIGLAAAWEVAENSTLIIERYRKSTMSLDYMGDSVTNGTADVLCCAVGFWVARWLGWKWTLGLIVATELLLLWLIRDNLTLNIVMLVWPIEAVKE